ncbi:MAG TPA: heme ABC transporter ATP-binding protein [Acidimicrobiales bacterium]|nr:heme ABC transporter ATP-binding protein [Acidimicrobiales bacterium]
MAVLTVEGATVSVGRATILTQADLTLTGGEVTIIIGPNGAGKSTLLSVAAGERKPQDGTVTLDGDDLTQLSVKELAKRRAVMPQDTTVAFPFTVREVVAMGRTVWNDGAAADDRVAMEALEAIGLTPFADRAITTLSGGEHQLVAFARVIAQVAPVGDNSVVLLDEPTAAMDVAHAEATLTTARLLASQGAAVGIVLHDLDAAAAYADRLVLMSHGRVRSIGAVGEVCHEPLLSEVYGSPIEVYDHDGNIRVAPRRRLQSA